MSRRLLTRATAEVLVTHAERIDWVANDLQLSAARRRDATWMTSKDRMRRLVRTADQVEVITGTVTTNVCTLVVTPVLGVGVLIFTVILDHVEREEILLYG